MCLEICDGDSAGAGICDGAIDLLYSYCEVTELCQHNREMCNNNFPTTLKNHRALCHPTFNKYNTYGSLFINWNHSKPNQHCKTAKIILNPCPAVKIKMPHPLLIFSQSDYLCQIFYANSQTNSADLDQWPTDLDLTRFQMQGITGFSSTRVKTRT